MAHPCPECGYTCHCGGDIDDCCFDGTPEERDCTHCPLDGYDDDDDDHDDDVCVHGVGFDEDCDDCGLPGENA